MTKIPGTLHEDRYTFMITSSGILLRVRNTRISNKVVQNLKTYYILNNFRKSCCLWDNYCIVLYCIVLYCKY